MRSRVNFILVYLIIIVQTGCSKLPTIGTGGDETIQFATPASRRNFIPGSGYLVVTNKQLLFKPVEGWTPIRKLAIGWNEISYIKKRNTILGFPWIVRIGTTGGKSYRFAVSEREEFLQAINQAQADNR